MASEQTPLLISAPREEGLVDNPPLVASQEKPQGAAIWKKYTFLFLFALILIGSFNFIPPFVGQMIVNRSRLEVVSVAISSPTNSTFQTHLVSILHLPIAAPAKLLKSRVAVEFEGEILGFMAIPEQYIRSRKSKLEIKGQFDVVDSGTLGAFSERLINDASVSWTVKGQLKLQVLGIPISGVLLKQTMKLEGMRGMSNITIHSIDLPGDHPLGGIHIQAHATLMNPTNTTLSTGTVSYAMEYRGLLVSLVQTNDLHLLPGANKLELEGRMLVQDSVKNLDIVSGFVSNFLRGDTLNIRVRGLGVQPVVSWLDSAIKHHVVDIPFQNPMPTDFVKGINISSLSTEFTPQTAYSPLAGASITAEIDSPFDFPFNITAVAENMILSSNGAMADLVIPETQTITSRNGKAISVTTSFSGVPLRVFSNENSHRQFESFLSEMVFNSSSLLHVKGDILACVETAIGPLRLAGIPLRVPMEFPGMAGLRDPPPTLGELVVTGLNDGKVAFKTQATLTNPTQFSGALGDVHLGIFYSGAQVGNVTLLGFELAAHEATRLDAVGTFNLPKCHAHDCDTKEDRTRQQFLSSYITGDEIQVGAQGYDGSTNIASLKPALANLNYTMAVPRVPELLQGSQFSILKRGVILDLANPFDGVTVRVLSIRANASHFGTDLGTIDIDFTTPKDPIRNPRGQYPILLPPKSSVKTSPLPIKIKGLAWDIIRSALDGVLLINITTKASASLYADSSHPIFINFDKLNIETQVHL